MTGHVKDLSKLVGTGVAIRVGEDGNGIPIARKCKISEVEAKFRNVSRTLSCKGKSVYSGKVDWDSVLVRLENGDAVPLTEFHRNKGDVLRKGLEDLLEEKGRMEKQMRQTEEKRR